MAVEDGNVAVFHQGIFIDHDHTPATEETGAATISFPEGDIGHGVFTQTFTFYIISHFRISRVHISVGIARIKNIIDIGSDRLIGIRSMAEFDLEFVQGGTGGCDAGIKGVIDGIVFTCFSQGVDLDSS